MSDIARRSVDGNQILWLREGPGCHGDQPGTPQMVELSLKDCFNLRQDSEAAPGLRPAQLGALHALLSRETLEVSEPSTVVMPTGTGKTETMLALFAHSPGRFLIVVPSDSLRKQTAEKFATLGKLPEFEIVTGEFRCPVVGLVKRGLKTGAEVEALLQQCNVVVATASAIAHCAPEASEKLVEMCDRLIVDEAHHVAARTWQAVVDRFAKRPIAQFTATPFREDGQLMGGRIIYAYPLRLAQKHGFFATINYRAVSSYPDPDRSVATAAIAQLRSDQQAGLDHLLMARVQSMVRAHQVATLYDELAPDLKPVVLHSGLNVATRRAALDALQSRESRIVVCVDMLGEGFDLPALKVAAIHDPHRSLAVTLQFVGRFARTGNTDLGEASAFIPRQWDHVDERLRRLYGEDADWNALIRDLTGAEVEREQARTDFEGAFGTLPAEISLRSLQPKMSTVVYSSAALEWNPDAIYDLFPEEALLTKKVAVNQTQRVAWFVTEERTPVPWGDVSTLSEAVHHLYIVHCDTAAGLLYINSSFNDSLHSELARAVGGQGVAIIKGDVVYRVLAAVQRRVPTNIGLLDTVNRNRRFTMHVGADVLQGFGPTAAQKAKTNIFAHGYSGGTRVSFGASRKGRVWSHRVAFSLLQWVEWAHTVGAYLTDESIALEDVMSGFIIPKEATTRPELVPLGIDWPPDILASTTDARQVRFQGDSHPILDLDLEISNRDATGPIIFDVISDSWRLSYVVEFGDEGPRVTPVGEDAEIELPKGTRSLSAFITERGMTIYFEQEAIVSPDGYFMQPNRARPRFEADRLEDWDWSNTNIRIESQGANRNPASIQHRAVEKLSSEADWEVVLDDDGTGEIADIVLLRRAGDVLLMTLAHCKYSSEDAPGGRVADLYEVCGQANKCHKARSEIDLILRKLRKRELNRASKGATGFLKGDMDALDSIRSQARLLDIEVTVAVVQPGLSRAAMSPAIAELLACTELYLDQTYGSQFRVICSN